MCIFHISNILKPDCMFACQKMVLTPLRTNYCFGQKPLEKVLIREDDLFF